MAKKDKPETSFDQFTALDIRVGTICSASIFEQARQPAYKIEVDFGPEIGKLKTSAQLTHRYLPEDLLTADHRNCQFPQKTNCKLYE